MRDRLFSLAGIRSGEKYMVSVVIVQALFLGLFFGAYDISAHSMFLSVFDIKMLARGYALSGLSGIILLSFCHFFRERFKSGQIAVINVLITAVITLVLWLLLALNPSKWVIFLSFILLAPLNILAVMGFRRTSAYLFSVVSGKRFFTLLETSLLAGIIISCFLVPVLLSFNFQLHNFLLISVISVIIAAILQSRTVSIPSTERALSHENNATAKRGMTILNIFRDDQYTRILGVFIILSVVSLFFIQYLFLAVVQSRFSTGPEIARFLGIFTGSVMIVALAGKWVLFTYCLKSLGLRLCLMIAPFMLAIVTIIVVLLGMISGYTLETAAGFMIIFFLLALNSLLSKSLYESVENSSLKLILQAIDEKGRDELQILMDSTVKEVAVLLAGLLLVLFGLTGFVTLVHISWILLAFLLIWLFIAFRLYSSYRNSIRKGIEKEKALETQSHRVIEQPVYKSRYSGERLFRMDYFNLISGDYEIFEKNGNRHYFNKILDHTMAKRDINLLPVIKKMSVRNTFEDIRQQSATMLKNIDEITSSWKKEDERIVTAKKVLSETRMPQTTEILRLLRDKSLESKRLAVYMIGKFKLTDMLPEVCESLNINGLETDTTAVLRAFGSSAEEELMRFYLVSSGNINTSKTILRLLAGLPSKESTGFLFSRLWSNSRQLKEVAVNGLIDCGFTPSEEDTDRLHHLISDIVGLMTWNLSAARCLEKNNDSLLLAEMRKELGRWERFLFNVLSLTCDTDTIDRIRKNLASGSFEGVHYAHAIIDVIADESIKAKIVSLLDVISDDEKLKNLNRFYPVEIPQYNKLLEDILNRDYNLMSLWTKACVLRYLPGIKDDELAESVVALLFSPESILQEEAARLIARSNPELYRSVYNRIPTPVRKHLDNIIDKGTGTEEFLFEKIQFLAGCFPGIIEDELFSLARNISYTSDIKSLMAFLPDEFILWSCTTLNSRPETFIFYSSRIGNLLDRTDSRENRFYYVLSLKAVEEFLYQYPDNANNVLGYLEINEKL